MKELSIEDKAKRYDEAIKKARNIVNSINVGLIGKNSFEAVFPELKESEDEKIIQFLIHEVKETSDKIMSYRGMNKEAVLAWLEKQGEQNTADVEEPDFFDDFRKTDSEVEPKFKVRDWVVENEPNNYARFIQILEIVNVQGKDRYRISRDIHKDEDVVEFGFVEKYYHNFDIQDAKTGDVLHCWIDGYEFILIFNCIKDGYVNAFCHLYNNLDSFSEEPTTMFCRTIQGHFTPATKEQRDQLEKAMNDAGYTFDFEKKELKKIVVPIFKIGDTIIKKHNSDILYFGSFTITDITGGKYWYNDRIICDITEQDEWEIYEPVRQNPAWSEDDQSNFCELRSFIVETYRAEDASKLITWLESLKERVQPQPKQEWSEEDEIRINSTIKHLEEHEGDTPSPLKPYIWEDIKWLKSLRPQSQWKPNKEQMDMLAKVCSTLHLTSGENEIMESIYDALKKLMEE